MKKNYTTYNDRQLISTIKGSGKSESDSAFAALYDRYAPLIRGYCKCLLNDGGISEDIFQRTIIAFYENIKSGTLVDNVPGYLINISKKILLNYYRDTKLTREVSIDDTVIDERDAYDNKELFDLIVRSLDLLDFEYREAFVMRKFINMPFKEIAENQNVTLSCAKMRVNRAQERIKNILSPYIKDLSENL